MQTADVYVAPVSGLKRLAAIDASRGWAALYVVSFHLAMMPGTGAEVPEWLKPMISAGGSGVTLFFILSAFSLCHTWRVREGEPNETRSFYIRRFFRIAPLFFFCLLLAYFRDVWFFGVFQSPGKVLLSSTFLFNLIPGEEQGFVWASWTIGVEMLFYALFPLIFAWANSISRAVGFLLLTLTAALAWDHLSHSFGLAEPVRASFVHFSFLKNLPCFALGVVLFHVYVKYAPDRRRYQELRGVLALSGVFLFGATISGNMQFLFDGLYWLGVAYGLILFGQLIGASRLVVNSVTEFCGEISYSLYLNHPVIVFLLSPVYKRVYQAPLSPTLHYMICLALTLAILIPVSYATYRLIERPGMRLGNWIIQARAVRGCGLRT